MCTMERVWRSEDSLRELVPPTPGSQELNSSWQLRSKCLCRPSFVAFIPACSLRASLSQVWGMN